MQIEISLDTGNLDTGNLDTGNLDVENRDVENRDVENRDVENRDVENRDVENRDVENPAVAADRAGSSDCEDVAEAEEARWLARARAGEQASIGWLIARYRVRAVRLATSILRRTDEAEDVAQEAFIRAFRNLHAFRGDGRFYTWLYHIIVRLCLDRQRIRRWNAEEAVDLDELKAGAAHLTAQDIDNHVLVEMLLDRLSPPMRAMLVLREVEGLEYEEIATVLDIPIGRVKWRLHEARAQFRVLWQDVMREVDNV